MYERFTDRARKVMLYAQQEAQRFNHEWADAPHILLGLVKEGSGIAGHVLLRLGYDLIKVRAAFTAVVPPGEDTVTMGALPHTPAAKLVVAQAMVVARDRKDGYVGTEHVLLGLLGAAPLLPALAMVLAELQLDVVTVVAAVQHFVPPPDGPADIGAAVQAVELAASQNVNDTFRNGLLKAAELLRAQLPAEPSETVVQLPHGQIRAGCLDADDPDARRGDYIAVDADAFEGQPANSYVLEMADEVGRTNEQVIHDLAILVRRLWMATAPAQAPDIPIGSYPAVTELRWVADYFMKWLQLHAEHSQTWKVTCPLPS